MFYCHYCNNLSSTLLLHLKHQKIHSSILLKYHCGYKQCKKICNNEKSLRSHVSRLHSRNRINTHDDYKSQLPKRFSNQLTCTVPLCKQECQSLCTFIKHLKNHIRNGLSVKCPYDNCKKNYNKLNSFTCHLSKCHRFVKINEVKKNVDHADQNDLDDNHSDRETEFAIRWNRNETLNDVNVNDQLVDGAIQVNNDEIDQLFLKNLAIFFLKLEAQLFIPSSSVQYIATQICDMHQQSQEIVKNNLLTHVNQLNICSNEVNDIINKAFECNPFLIIGNDLKSTYKRNNFFKKNFFYVEPVQIKLTEINNKPIFFHYVPLKETLKHILDNKFLQNELNLEIKVSANNLLEDFTDGSVFKSKSFFLENPKSLRLILYQDSFEVVNPLGPAKSKYKILAVYLNIGNYSQQVRSHVDSMLLVALCREKFFCHEKVYGKIVNDLSDIEKNGISLSNGEIIKGSLVFIAGDNLGSHSLGGFSENFSKSIYFCRYCLVSRQDFYSGDGALEQYEERTVDSYKKAIKIIEKTSNKKKTINSNTKIMFKGIKFDSIFNRLNNFHVCDPGLPPCLGHDIFEGIVAYDLKIFIDYFVQNLWFSYDFLNDQINSFPYSIEDSRDKPCIIKIKADKLSGQACQIWVFLKLFPLMIETKIKDIHDEVWKSVLLLTEIVEIVCAPAIHTSCVAYLESIINEYILLRSDNFNRKIVPKHHYLSHYPQLILKFGPLMNVWTLRFESKHSFFKQAIRSMQNFVNITKSLTEKHELFQALLKAGADSKSVITDIKESIDFDIKIYSSHIQKVIEDMNFEKTMYECYEINVRGTLYKRHDGLLISLEGYQYNVKIGKIVNIIHDEENVFFIVGILETQFLPYLRAYRVEKIIEYKCVSQLELISTEKLHMYDWNNFLLIKPKYGFVKNGL